jgi:hypothetical protein
VSENEQEKPAVGSLLLLVLGVYLLILLVMLALAIGLGWLLRKIIPAVEVGTGIVIGLLAAGFALHLLIKIFGALFRDIVLPPQPIEEEEDDEPPVIYALPPLPGRRRKMRRRQRH